MGMRSILRTMETVRKEFADLKDRYDKLVKQHNSLLQILGAHVEQQEGKALLVAAQAVFDHDLTRRRVRVKYVQGDPDFVLTVREVDPVCHCGVALSKHNEEEAGHSFSAAPPDTTGPQNSVDTTDVCIKHAVRKIEGQPCPECQAEANKILLV